MMIQQYLLFVIPLGLSLVITPAIIWYAKRVGAIDQPNERKVHHLPIPRLGGIAIYVSFFLSLALSLYLDPAHHAFSSMSPKTGVMLVISLTLVLLLGIWDDLRPLTPGKKFMGQILAGTIVYLAGFRISGITHPFGTDLLNLGFLDYPATLLWVVGITNAFNLIDGLDGLASGVAFIVSLTMFAISYLKGDMTIAIMALLLSGAILGFLRYNFNGARIFLGDSGSLFLGFCLAILSMQSSTKGSTAFSIIVPVLALGLPIMDTLLSMTRRLLRSVMPDEKNSPPFFRRLLSMFLPDRGHIHHQLIARGYSHRKVVLVLYVVSCLFGFGAFAVTVTNNVGASLILVIIAIATFVGISQLRYKEMAVLRNGILLPLYDRPLMNSGFFQSFLDIAFMAVAYVVSHKLAFRSEPDESLMHAYSRTLIVVCGIQLVVFYLGGLYKGSFRQLGVGDFLRVLKAVTAGTVVTAIVMAFLPAPWNIFNLTLGILDFYILLSLVLGARVSFNILNYLSRKEKQTGKKRVLIYGADARGSLILQQLLNDDNLDMCPIGFLDDDPKMEGKSLNGYPVFGSHWKLHRLTKRIEVDEILLCSETMRREVLRRLQGFARTQGIALRRFGLKFEEMGTDFAHPSVVQVPVTIMLENEAAISAAGISR